MTTPNLERLVENYVSGDMSLTDLHIKPTYHMYDQLLKLLSTRGQNIQQAMTAILPILHRDVTVPSKISNITRKVTKHIDSGADVDEIISDLFPAQKNQNEISSLCTQVGITIDSLFNEQPISISSEHVTNQLIYDLENYRQRSKMPWSEAVRWHQKLFPLDKSDAATEKNISNRWSRNYKKIRHMKITKSKDLNDYLKSAHIAPTKRKISKEQVLYKLPHPPADQINAAPDPLLAMAEIQGAIMRTRMGI